MLSDFIRLRTEDDFELVGLVHEPEHPSDVAVVFVHGLGSNGFISYTDSLAEMLPAAGVALFRGNLRDSEMLRIDEFKRTAKVRKGGGAYHSFEYSVLDIGVWVDEAERRGYSHVILFGHSLGSLKATNYLFHTRDLRVIGLILASTADLIAMHENRYSPEERSRFLGEAETLIAEGRGRKLMSPECTVGLMHQPISAASYVDRFGAAASWDVMDLYDRGSPSAFTALHSVSVPILAMFGTENETVLRSHLDEAFCRLRREARNAPSFSQYVLEGANHFYSGYGNEVFEATISWLEEFVLAGNEVY